MMLLVKKAACVLTHARGDTKVVRARLKAEHAGKTKGVTVSVCTGSVTRIFVEAVEPMRPWILPIDIEKIYLPVDAPMCTSNAAFLVEPFLATPSSSPAEIFLVGVFMRAKYSRKETILGSMLERWFPLTRANGGESYTTNGTCHIFLTLIAVNYLLFDDDCEAKLIMPRTNAR